MVDGGTKFFLKQRGIPIPTKEEISKTSKKTTSVPYKVSTRTRPKDVATVKKEPTMQDVSDEAFQNMKSFEKAIDVQQVH